MKTIEFFALFATAAACAYAAPPPQPKALRRPPPPVVTAVPAPSQATATPAPAETPPAAPAAPAPAPATPPPPPAPAPPPPPAPPQIPYQQTTAARPVLVTPEQAKSVIDRFKAAYAKLGSPRMLVYVNRELVDEQAGLKLVGRTEQTQSTRSQLNTEFRADPQAPKDTNAVKGSTSVTVGGNVTVVGDVKIDGVPVTPGRGSISNRTDRAQNENTYRVQERNPGALADKQTVRDVERLFGRPLRLAGVSLADQRIATQLIAGKPLKTFIVPTEGEQAQKDREALAKIADVVLEILISSHQMIVPEVSGDSIYNEPDIQATAIRLRDSKIMGQATAKDIIGKDRYAGRILRNFDVRDIAEATALSLMEDMMLGVGQ